MKMGANKIAGMVQKKDEQRMRAGLDRMRILGLSLTNSHRLVLKVLCISIKGAIRRKLRYGFNGISN